MTAWAAVELARLRQSRAALLVVLVFTLTVLPLAGPYLDQPGLVGGRVHTIVLRGSFTTVASDFAANAVDHVGQLFFVPDPNPRHGLPDGGRFGVVLLPLFVLGLVVAHRERLAARAEWRGLVAVGTVLVLGASLAMRDSSPNSYRTGALAPLAAARHDRGGARRSRARRGRCARCAEPGRGRGGRAPGRAAGCPSAWTAGAGRGARRSRTARPARARGRAARSASS